MKIILVEDDPDVSDILIDFLSKIFTDLLSMHYSLKVYKSTIQAWENIRYSSEDNLLVITDVDTPGCLNGIEFLNKIKRLSSKIKVIVMSGDDSYEAQAKDRGADTFLAKPVKFSLLLETIKSLTIKKE